MAFSGNGFSGALNSFSSLPSSGGGGTPPEPSVYQMGFNTTEPYSVGRMPDPIGLLKPKVIAINNSINPNSYIRGVEDPAVSMTKLTIGYKHTPDDVNGNKTTIADVGIYRNGVLWNAYTVTIPAVDTDLHFHETVIDVPIDVGQEFTIAVNYSGDATWLAYEATDSSGTIMYFLNSPGVLTSYNNLPHGDNRFVPIIFVDIE